MILQLPQTMSVCTFYRAETEINGDPDNVTNTNSIPNTLTGSCRDTPACLRKVPGESGNSERVKPSQSWSQTQWGAHEEKMLQVCDTANTIKPVNSELADIKLEDTDTENYTRSLKAHDWNYPGIFTFIRYSKKLGNFLWLQSLCYYSCLQMAHYEIS